MLIANIKSLFTGKSDVVKNMHYIDNTMILPNDTDCNESMKAYLKKNNISHWDLSSYEKHLVHSLFRFIDLMVTRYHLNFVAIETVSDQGKGTNYYS